MKKGSGKQTRTQCHNLDAHHLRHIRSNRLRLSHLLVLFLYISSAPSFHFASLTTLCIFASFAAPSFAFNHNLDDAISTGSMTSTRRNVGTQNRHLLFPKDPSKEGSDPSRQVISTVVENEYLVIFKRYLTRAEHHEVLAKALGEDSENETGNGKGWTYIERNNPASHLPSDFALIKLPEQNATHKELNEEEAGNVSTKKVDTGEVVAGLTAKRLMELLRASGEVKHVVPHRRLVNVLKFSEMPDEFGEDEEPLRVEGRPVYGPFEERTESLRVDGTKLSTDPFDVNIKGRPHTSFAVEENNASHSTMRRLQSSLIQVSHLFHADYLWDKSYTGTGIKVAVFDTGLRKDHPHFRNVRDPTNWTDEPTTDDGLGHGTFVAGVIASQTECLGFAPDADVHIFRVFTNDRVSYTSWFLDAFNYAIHTRVNVLNLSIGGPDFLDIPFIEKVWEMSANNVIIVSAIGNDGPLYGTLNNPADQMDVIGVGGINFRDQMAAFSSRGMTTWELPAGYGRVKPDIVAYGKGVSGSRIFGGCRSLSGTSVASPVVAGAVTLLASTIPEPQRWEMINPASMKQVLVESAERIGEANVFEQGAGKLNLLGAYELLQEYSPRASVMPSSLDLTQCPYMWPYCSQPIYHTGVPIIANLTILNGMGVIGEIVGEPQWRQGTNGHLIELAFTYPEKLWPWTGYFAVHIRASPQAAQFEGTAEGQIEFTVTSPPGIGETADRTTQIVVPLRVRIVPTPAREKRILFDQFHNLRYPSGYFPRDALWMKNEPFDWNGDHMHTNLRDMYNFLRSKGYYVEVLGAPFTCFNASLYGTLMLFDLEDEFFPAEIDKLKKDVEERGLSVAVFADWYHLDVMRKIKFFDENTRQWWTPATGGANLPALNDLLKPFGIAFGDRIYDGDFQLAAPEQQASFSSGAAIAKFPRTGTLLWLALEDQSHEILSASSSESEVHRVRARVPVLGLLSTRRANTSLTTGGRIAVFGDSSCLDSANQRTPCHWLLAKMLQYTSRGLVDENVFGVGNAVEHLDNADFVSDRLVLPSRLPPNENDLRKFSRVLIDGMGADGAGENTVYRSMLCEQPERPQFQSFEQTDDQVSLVWEEPVSAREGEQTGPTGMDRIPGQEQTELIRDNINGYFVPYLAVCAVVVAVLMLAARGRKDRLLSKRIPV